jgi:hypothetical protein
MDAIERLGDEIGELAARLDAATRRLLACIRQFDEAGGWERQGAVSCAHWLSWRVGLDLGSARERVRVARALGALPLIDAAFARGELSYAKVRAMTRVATTASEDRLLELARHATGAQLERICRSFRQVQANMTIQAGDEQAPAAESRSVRERHLPGGMVRLELVLLPDEAALVMQALEKTRDELRNASRADRPAPALCPAAPDVSAETPDAGEATAPSRADAVVHLAHTTLLEGASSARSTGGDRYQLMVHLDQDVLAPDGDWAATLDDGTRVSAETLRRIACDTGLVATRTGAAMGDGPAVLDIGRRSRSIPPAIRRALWLRDRGCRFPGCTHTRFLHGHHLQHWLHGGSTSLANLVLLCPHHHRLVHEGGFRVATAHDGALVFRAPTAAPIAPVPARDQIDDAVLSLRQWAAEREIEIGPDTNLPWWDGAVPDYDAALSALLD